ncbi:sigma factor [Falsiroseomonas sp. HW251]|uniref:sigma factor n=1 Tax=Falsiroseomonas sp. HW251 TaxID=3390998 RepID=UPI003D31DCB3
MATQGPRPSPQPASWDPDRLAASLAIAGRYAHRGGRRLSLSRCDREDLRQDILLAMLERDARFDAARGRWAAFATILAQHAVADRVRARRRGPRPVFVDLDLDAFPAGASATQCDEVDPDIALDLARVGDEIPAPCRLLLDLIRRTTDIADAQREASGSCAAFYRAMAELRCWLHAAGLRPTRATPMRAPSSANP